MATKPRSKLPVTHFGRPWAADVHPAEAALCCFKEGYVDEKRGSPTKGWGRFEFFKYAAQHYLPMIKWVDASGKFVNTWLEAQVRSLCDDEHAHKIGKTIVRCVYWTGAAASGKTHAAGFYAFMWWQADPDNSCVTLTSTTKEAVGQRVWPVIQKCYLDWRDPWTGAPKVSGNMVDSMKKVQTRKGDDLHAIHAMAVEKGDLNRAVNGIKGRHTKRMMLIIDEANNCPNAVFEVIHNMSAGCQELVIVVIGNALSRLDNHGRCCEPEKGWESITIDTGKWITAGVPDWKLDPGICLHFDGNKSPNVLAKQTVFPFLYSYENFLRRRHGVKSPQHWSSERGFWPTSGIISTVLDELLMTQADVRGTFTFDGETRTMAALDPGFTGDAAMAVVGRMGMVGGKMCLFVLEERGIEANAESLDPIDYQVARGFIKFCKDHKVNPADAGVDATGTGRGVYAMLQEEWSPDVVRVEFGGAASEMQASADDSRPGNKAYGDKVTELWYSVRHLVQGGQLRGLSRDAVTQFCTREFVLMPRDRVMLDAKKICKQKLGRSPDNADAVAVLCHIGRMRGLVAQTAITERATDDWDKLVKDTNDIINIGMTEAFEPEITVEQNSDWMMEAV